MANEPAPGSKAFPSAKSGASDDDIFAEMGRMLAQDQLGAAPAKPRPAKPATAAAGEDAPLELTHVVKPGKPQMAPQPAAAAATVTPSPVPARPAPPVAPPVAAPSKGTKIGEAVAMLDGQPKAAAGVTVSNRSLDTLVQDMVRPMIQEWINQNMERIVREEAAKAVAKAAPNT